MKRLFFALSVSESWVKNFLPSYKKLKINADQKEISVKWVPTDNFHVTMTFLGDQDEKNIPDLQIALQNICQRFAPFALKVEDMSAFSKETDARVIYLGVQNKKYLGEIKNALDHELQLLDDVTVPPAREYAPHLTVGRLRNPRSVKDMISPFKRKSFGKIQVDEIILYESKLQGAFPIYTPIARCKLTGSLNLQEDVDPAAIAYNDATIIG
jgi:2'-5' RNA ligase